MRVAVVGSGGREHAIVKKIAENKRVTELYALCGNGGMTEAVCVDIKPTDVDGIVKFATEKKLDYVVVAPDDPLAMGLTDRLREAGIASFGPSQAAAEIESSKVFAKNLMKKYGIPTASYEVFSDIEKALDFVKTAPLPLVVKADGLALGKGVIIANTRDEATDAVNKIMRDKAFGKSGDEVVIEEFLTGPEVSVLAFTDGKTVVPMVSSMDHKRIGDGDTGLNTGGMGTIAPNPYYTPAVADECMKKIFLPTIEAMNAEGRTFCGCLYFGLMLTPSGAKVIEYNCRFGDPETQVVLPLLKTDLLTVMRAVSEGRLGEIEVGFSDEAAACVIMASGGYPEAYEKGKEIDVPSDVLPRVYFAGAAEKNGKLYTNGGRVLGVTNVASTLGEAIERSYADVKRIKFEGAYYRTDIGAKAMKAKE